MGKSANPEENKKTKQKWLCSETLTKPPKKSRLCKSLVYTNSDFHFAIGFAEELLRFQRVCHNKYSHIMLSINWD